MWVDTKVLIQKGLIMSLQNTSKKQDKKPSDLYTLRADGRYCYTVTIGKKANGKPDRKYIYAKTETEMKRKIKAFNEDFYRYGCVIKTKFTLALWLKEFLFVNKLNKIGLTTFTRYEGIYRNYILNSQIGNMPLDSLTLNDFQRFFNTIVCKDDGTVLSQGTLKKIKNLLHNALDCALKNDLIRRNPIDGVEIPNIAAAPKVRRTLTTAEQTSYLEAISDSSYRFILLTAFSTGLRLGELIALTWSNIDFENRKILVSKAVATGKMFQEDGSYTSTKVVKTPKSSAGIRKVPISADLSLLLYRIYQLQRNKALKEGKSSTLKDQLVFQTQNKTMYNKRNIQRAHERICQKANIDYINFHGLRHTYASNLLDKELSLLTIRDILGHAKTSTTEIYTHTTNEAVENAHETIDEIYRLSSSL